MIKPILFVGFVVLFSCDRPQAPIATAPTPANVLEPFPSVSKPVSVDDRAPTITKDILAAHQMPFAALTTVATVNGKPIEAYRFNYSVINDRRLDDANALVERLIDDALIESAAREVQVDDQTVEDLTRFVFGQMFRFGPKSSMEEEREERLVKIDGMRMSEKQLHSEIKRQLTVGGYLRERYFKPDKATMESMMEEEGSEEFWTRARLQIQMVRFEFGEESEAPLAYKDALAFFAELRESDMGFQSFARMHFPHGRTADTYWEHRDRYPNVHHLEVGDVAPPFRDGKDVIVMRVVRNEPARKMTRDEILTKLSTNHFNAELHREKLVKSLREGAKIEVHPDAIVYP